MFHTTNWQLWKIETFLYYIKHVLCCGERALSTSNTLALCLALETVWSYVHQVPLTGTTSGVKHRTATFACMVRFPLAGDDQTCLGDWWTILGQQTVLKCVRACVCRSVCVCCGGFSEENGQQQMESFASQTREAILSLKLSIFNYEEWWHLLSVSILIHLTYHSSCVWKWKRDAAGCAWSKQQAHKLRREQN